MMMLANEKAFTSRVSIVSKKLFLQIQMLTNTFLLTSNELEAYSLKLVAFFNGAD